jgi:hypothetical protein
MRIETDPQNGDWITVARQIHGAGKYKKRVSLVDSGKVRLSPLSVWIVAGHWNRQASLCEAMCRRRLKA